MIDASDTGPVDTQSVVEGWKTRCLSAVPILGACLGNLYVPIAGILVGLLLGLLVGLFAWLFTVVLSRRVASNGVVFHRLMQITSLLFLAGIVLWCFLSMLPHFHNPPSKYISKGEWQDRFVSMIVWPALLVAAYLLLAGVPSKANPIFGAVSKGRGWTIRALIIVMFVSCLLIGTRWIEIPSPD